VTLNQYQVLEVVHSGFGVATIFTNGMQGAQGPVSNIGNITRTGNFLGANSSASSFFDGQIAEVLVYNRALTASERASVEGYLYARYAITVTPPIISPGTGVYVDAPTVSLASDPGAQIYYTTDGSPPSSSSSPYSGPLAIEGSVVVKAIAIQPFGSSSVS